VGLGACFEHQGGDVLSEAQDWAEEGHGVAPAADVDFANVPRARGGREEVVAGGLVAEALLEFGWGFQGEANEIDIGAPVGIPEGAVEQGTCNFRVVAADGHAESSALGVTKGQGG
jgi:hypothetical protein